MNSKKIKCMVSLFLVIVQIFILTGCLNKEKIRIYDNTGNVFVNLDDFSLEENKLNDENYRAYLEIVLDEAVSNICMVEKCSEEEARTKLFENEYQIYTSFDETIYKSIKNTYEEQKKDGLSFGCAVTDLQGKLLAVYSGGDSEEYKNYASIKTSPYSTFDSLSVYAPAIEARVINWSKVYRDDDTNTNVTVLDGVKQSVNDVAVKALQDYSLNNSIQFLKENFNLDLDYDEKAENVALGNLYNTISLVDMAGYYQIFANGGVYKEPRTIVKICDKNGEIVYRTQSEGKQVIGNDTAYIMNQLLQNVVDNGGTGADAKCEGVEIGGKTGTGENGNWFVGFTPEYSCALWHGNEIRENEAPKMFSSIISEFVTEDGLAYPEDRNVFISAYCSESGMFASDKCRKINMGYYTLDDCTAVCNIH